MGSVKDKPQSTESYKGVRDFYPEDQAVLDYIFNIWRLTAESFGYEEYGASILEPAELYQRKSSSQEIVDEQTYTFKDRADRDVTLRPEMTPTVTRMVAGKERELTFPVRWYSIPNVFRYERPQRGRLREHWQLNIDAFGLPGSDIEVEIILLAKKILENFGFKEKDYEIRVNSRKALTETLKEKYNLDEGSSDQFMKLLDKKDRIKDFDEKSKEILGREYKKSDFKSEEVSELLKKLENLGVKNAKFDPGIVRGFDYYTGMVFEIFDKDKENSRSMFGGGRYDGLLSIFGKEDVPAVGFGMGDVTLRDSLESHNLLPKIQTNTDLYLCVLDKNIIPFAQETALQLRDEGLNVEIDFTEDKAGKQVKRADKKQVPFIACLGDDEVKSKKFKVKELESGKEVEIDLEKITDFILQKRFDNK